jgi:hypothetical protein
MENDDAVTAMIFTTFPFFPSVVLSSRVFIPIAVAIIDSWQLAHCSARQQQTAEK